MVCKYPNEATTTRVWRALKSGRQLRLDVNGWYVDAQTGELIGPAPAIELLSRMINPEIGLQLVRSLPGARPVTAPGSAR